MGYPLCGAGGENSRRRHIAEGCHNNWLKVVFMSYTFPDKSIDRGMEKLLGTRSVESLPTLGGNFNV